MTPAARRRAPAPRYSPGPLGPDPDTIIGNRYNPAASRHEPRLAKKAPGEAGGAAPQQARDRARDCREAGTTPEPR